MRRIHQAQVNPVQSLRQFASRRAAIVSATAFTLASSACTGQIADAFRLSQQVENFTAQSEINTKVDILWVVDSSAGMDVSQQRLRDGFVSFSSKYMKPTWDIRMGVIAADTFLAHPTFSNTANANSFLMRRVGGSVGATSTYIQGRIGTWVNPSIGSPQSWQSPRSTALLNTSVTPARFDSGIRAMELVPAWGPDYARLLPGLHDGPIPGLCSEALPYFLGSSTNCAYRDAAAAPRGTAECLNASATDSISRCVNTIQNDSVRSGKAIIETKPPTGQSGNAAWQQQLLNDAIVNLTTGSVGHGSERGFQSVLQLLSDNEAASSTTKLFRPGSVRAIIFVSNEDDQSITIPTSSIPANFSPYTNYQCDQSSLLALNVGREGFVTGSNGYCCTGSGCAFQNTSGCATKTVDGFTFTPSICPASAQLVAVSSVKSQLDAFFRSLDGDTGADPNYIVSAIVALNGSTIQSLHTERAAVDLALNQVVTFAIDRGDRYASLVSQVGAGSQAMDIGASDYTPLLDSIGRAIIEKRATFKLSRLPSGQEEMVVDLMRSGGGSTRLGKTQYAISGTTLQIVDLDLVLTLGIGDTVRINYQPISL